MPARELLLDSKRLPGFIDIDYDTYSCRDDDSCPETVINPVHWARLLFCLFSGGSCYLVVSWRPLLLGPCVAVNYYNFFFVGSAEAQTAVHMGGFLTLAEPRVQRPTNLPEVCVDAILQVHPPPLVCVRVTSPDFLLTQPRCLSGVRDCASFPLAAIRTNFTSTLLDIDPHQRRV